MKIYKVDRKTKNIKIAIPLTEPTGKTRVKNRDIWYGYGYPVATKKVNFSNKNYIEWQIGYDITVDNSEKMKLTTLPDKRFIGSKGKEKVLYELSEYLFYFYDMDIISKKEIKCLLDEIKQIDSKKLIENNIDLSVNRFHPIEYVLEGIKFQKSIVQYPLLLYKFSSFEVLVEIVIKEKQYAIGLQPMLYICFPITLLDSEDGSELIGRCAKTNEKAYLTLDKKHKEFILQTFKIFALLSQAHKQDIISIIETILS